MVTSHSESFIKMKEKLDIFKYINMDIEHCINTSNAYIYLMQQIFIGDLL